MTTHEPLPPPLLPPQPSFGSLTVAGAGAARSPAEICVESVGSLPAVPSTAVPPIMPTSAADAVALVPVVPFTPTPAAVGATTPGVWYVYDDEGTGETSTVAASEEDSTPAAATLSVIVLTDVQVCAQVTVCRCREAEAAAGAGVTVVVTVPEQLLVVVEELLSVSEDLVIVVVPTASAVTVDVVSGEMETVGTTVGVTVVVRVLEQGIVVVEPDSVSEEDTGEPLTVYPPPPL